MLQRKGTSRHYPFAMEQAMGKPQAITITINALVSMDYPGSPDEQRVFARLTSLHQPIATMLALQPPGALAISATACFWLSRVPGCESYHLLFSSCSDSREEDAMMLNMVEGQDADGLNEFADELEQFLSDLTFEAGGFAVLPVWLDTTNPNELMLTPETAFTVPAHADFEKDPLIYADKRTAQLGEGWMKIAHDHWCRSRGTNGPVTHVTKTCGEWKVYILRGAHPLAEVRPQIAESFESAIPLAMAASAYL